MSKFAYYYDKSRNKQDAFYPGIPLRSLSQEDFDTLSPEQQRSVELSSWWRTREPEPEAPEAEPDQPAKDGE